MQQQIKNVFLIFYYESDEPVLFTWAMLNLVFRLNQTEPNFLSRLRLSLNVFIFIHLYFHTLPSSYTECKAEDGSLERRRSNLDAPSAF